MEVLFAIVAVVIGLAVLAGVVVAILAIGTAISAAAGVPKGSRSRPISFLIGFWVSVALLVVCTVCFAIGEAILTGMS